METLHQRLNQVNCNIKTALKGSKSNNTYKDIITVAVTKHAELEQMKEIYNLGITNVGENWVQKMIPKKEELTEYQFNWHFIGHLQSNKVKYIIDKITLLHSLDRYSLAKELNKRAIERDMTVNVLAQVNIAEDENKFGLFPEEVKNFLKFVNENYNGIQVKGLMTMLPYVEDNEKLRPNFREMFSLFKQFQKVYGSGQFEYLSMGMTNDYTVAIEEGANMIRIGSALFK